MKTSARSSGSPLPPPWAQRETSTEQDERVLRRVLEQQRREGRNKGLEGAFSLRMPRTEAGIPSYDALLDKHFLPPATFLRNAQRVAEAEEEWRRRNAGRAANSRRGVTARSTKGAKVPEALEDEDEAKLPGGRRRLRDADRAAVPAQWFAGKLAQREAAKTQERGGRPAQTARVASVKAVPASGVTYQQGAVDPAVELVVLRAILAREVRPLSA